MVIRRGLVCFQLFVPSIGWLLFRLNISIRNRSDVYWAEVIIVIMRRNEMNPNDCPMAINNKCDHYVNDCPVMEVHQWTDTSNTANDEWMQQWWPVAPTEKHGPRRINLARAWSNALGTVGEGDGLSLICSILKSEWMQSMNDVIYWLARSFAIWHVVC